MQCRHPHSGLHSRSSNRMYREPLVGGPLQVMDSPAADNQLVAQELLLIGTTGRQDLERGHRRFRARGRLAARRGRGNIPQTASPAGGGSWNRFGSTGSSGASSSGSSGYRGSSYGSGYTSSGGRSQLQISPPLVRQRGNYSAPSSSGPGYSAPHYSAPSYSAPAPHAAPSGGGGHSSSGGGGGHASSGGHHR